MIPKFKIGDKVFPTLAPHAQGDIRVAAVEIVYRISVDGVRMSTAYTESELSIKPKEVVTNSF